MTIREALVDLFLSWDNGDALRSGAHFAPEAVYREARHEPIAGRAAIVNHFTKFFRDGPPWKFYPDETLVEGSRAAIRYRFALERSEGGWHERSGCALVTFENGTIVEWREYEG